MAIDEWNRNCCQHKITQRIKKELLLKQTTYDMDRLYEIDGWNIFARLCEVDVLSIAFLLVALSSHALDRRQY